MAIPAVLALGARVGMPAARELIKKYGPSILDAAAGTGIGAFIGDKLFNLSDDVKTGSDLEAESKEEREAKKEKRKKQIKTVQGSRAAGMTADEQKAAAERGDFGPMINPFLVIDPDVNKPKILDTPELTEEEKLPTTTGGVIDINELINKPLITVPENIDTNLISDPIPEIEDFTILTIANKDKKFVKIGKKTYPKEQTELRYRTTDGRSYRVVKEEFKDKDEKERIANGEFVRETLPQFLEDNPTIKERLYTPKISGTKELEKIRKYYLNKHGIDFKTDTYKKIVSQTIGERGSKELTGKQPPPSEVAQKQFESILRDFAKQQGMVISGPEMDRYLQEFRIAIREQNPDKAVGEFYSKEDLRGASNLIMDTIFQGKFRKEQFGSDMGFDEYMDSFIKNRLDRKMQTKKNLETKSGETDKRKDPMKQIQTLGHTGSIAQGDILFGEAVNPKRYTSESFRDNIDKEKFMVKYRKALKENNTKEMTKIENQLKKRDLRAMYIDDDGFEVYIGAEPKEGQLKDGGMVDIFKMTKSLRAQR
jgi:hypothetical protein